MECDAAGSFGLVLSIDDGDGFAENRDFEVVHHDAGDAAMIDDLLKFDQVADFDGDRELLSDFREIFMHAVDGQGDISAGIDMIVFDHDPIVKAGPIVIATSKTYGFLFQKTHSGGRLTGIEDFDRKAFYFLGKQ